MPYVYPSSTDELEDEDLAARVRAHKVAQGKLRNILSDAIIRMNSLSDLALWPAEGWDYQTTLGTLLDLMPNRSDAELEAFARDEEP